MNWKTPLRRYSMSVLGLVIFTSAPFVAAGAEEVELSGLWKAHRILGPADAGTLLIRTSGDNLLAEFGGYRVKVIRDKNAISFVLPTGGLFSGELEKSGDIRGHWTQPRSKFDGNAFATPVVLRQQSESWQGEVSPQPDTATFYLLLKEDGEQLSAELINPDRNLGVFAQLSRVVRDQGTLALYGRFRGRGEERVMFDGHYYADEDIISLRYPGRGGNYDFQRVDAERATGFLARTPEGRVSVSTPPQLDDGWDTASLTDAGIDTALVLEMIETEILPEPESSRDLSIHSLLIARHGRLVVEEYFHGYHRNLPHDSRSASKSIVSILAASAMRSDVDLSWDTAVYSLPNTEELLRLEPRRGEITLRHLVNMNSGLDCDDRNPNSAANEDVLWDNADELDFYEHILNVDVVHAAGQVPAYCSASANLAGGVIAAAANQSLLRMIDRLVARPLDIQRYSVPVPPDGHPYMGGGTRWLPRDFLKFPQLILNGGQWNGHQVISEDAAKLLITPTVKMDGGRDYGYLWWTTDYAHGEGTVRAHFMGGNGGQIAMLIPDLQLSVVFNAGNYSDRVGFRIQEEIIPKYILPAIKK